MKNSQRKTPLLIAQGVDVNTPAGRPLLRGLNLSIGNEQVAIIGRNGVGKTTLLEVLSAQTAPLRGDIQCLTKTLLVPQMLECAEATQHKQAYSRGEQRKVLLLAAQRRHPGLLLLDEPTQDLDAEGIQWLQHWLSAWSNGLILVSHDARLLQHFQNFVIMTESGCEYFNGDFEALQSHLERTDADSQKKYLHHLHHLIEREEHHTRVARRRQRKKNRGRVTELGRMTPRVRLNSKRSYAQVSQGKAAKIGDLRIDAIRAWVKAARRALTVDLPMAQLMPTLPEDDGQAIVTLDNVSAYQHEQCCFKHLSLTVGRERIGVVGPNGAGKTTLLRTLLGQHPATAGRVSTQLAKVGSIAQGATDWMFEHSLLAHLLMHSNEASPDLVAQWLIAHRFPLALAERPFMSLSPGERVRAALICLLARSPTVECLLLDEPTNGLDFVGFAALRAGLKAWPGGWVVVSHDVDFLQDIGVTRWLRLDGRGGCG